MKLLTIVLNRVYILLTKVNNQSPLLGASILVSILISLLLNVIFLLVFALKPNAFKINDSIYYVIMFLIFLLTNSYARRNRAQVTNHSLVSGNFVNFMVVILCLFTIGLFIFFSSINRDKILTQTKRKQFDKPRKESLESKVKQWFE